MSLTGAEVDTLIEKYKSSSPSITVVNMFEGQQELTRIVGGWIRIAYDAINKSISSLDSKDPDMGEKKMLLLEMKKQVPRRFAISKDNMMKLNDALNYIKGGETSKVIDKELEEKEKIVEEESKEELSEDVERIVNKESSSL